MRKAKEKGKYRPQIYFSDRDEKRLKIAVLFSVEKTIDEFCSSAIMKKVEKLEEARKKKM